MRCWLLGGKGCGGGTGASCRDAELRAAAGDARGLQRFRKNPEQVPHHAGDGGVVFGSEAPSLAVEFGIDGNGDVSDGSHGFCSYLKNHRTPGGGNSTQRSRKIFRGERIGRFHCKNGVFSEGNFVRFRRNLADRITELVIFGSEEMPMTGEALKAAREEAKLTQGEAAAKLGLTQAYFSMMERGLRPVTEALALKAVRVFRMAETALPLKVDQPDKLDGRGFRAELGALGYPGLAKFRRGKPKYNPARLLLLALCQDVLDTGVVEALPWLVVKYVDLDWQWVLLNAKVCDCQNRLGFVVDVAEDVAKGLGDVERKKELREMKAVIERSRLAREDTLCGDSMNEKERKMLRRNRTGKARHWNLLTDVGG